MLSLLLVFITLNCLAQNAPISNINISMPASADANTANWGQGASPFTISAKTTLDSNRQVDPAVMESRILITIKKGGNKVCGSYTSSTAPYSSFNNMVQVWNGRNAVSLLGQDCTLQPGDYQLCVQFFGSRNGADIAFSDEKCKPFTIKGIAATNDITYQPPQAVLPADGALIKNADAKKPITFRWVPVVPRPGENVVYKVSVVEIRKGQSATEAMKSTSPLFEKEVVNQTQLVAGNLQLVAGENYGWRVQASNGNEKIFGTSGINTFKIIVDESNPGSCIKIDTTKYTITCKGLNANGQYIYQVQGLVFTKEAANTDPFMESGPTGGPVTNYVIPITPASASISNITPASVVASGTAVQTISFDIVSATALSTFTVNLQMSTYHLSAAGTKIYCSKNFELTFDVPVCSCKTCDSVQIKLQPPVTGQANNNVTVQQKISTLSLPSGAALAVKSITAEVIYFDIVKNDTLCYQCEKNSSHFGKFVRASLSNAPTFTSSDALPTGGIIYASPAPQPLSNATFNFEIAAPDINKCCTDTINVCIQYTVTTADCKSCSLVKCYQLKRQK